jgi:hypothetical protein
VIAILGRSLEKKISANMLSSDKTLSIDGSSSQTSIIVFKIDAAILKAPI